MSIKNFKIRLSNTLFPKRFPKKLFFVHLPKTGGTSVDQAFHDLLKTVSARGFQEYQRHDSMAAAAMAELLHGYDFRKGNSNDYPMQRFGIENVVYLMSQPKVRYISGHVCFSPKVFSAVSDQWDYLTVLRDPVDRYISEYFYLKYRNVSGGRRRRFDISEALEEYIDSYHGRLQGVEYVKYYGGLKQNSDEYFSDAAVAQAIENLGKFRAVGRIEEIDVFAHKIKALYGIDIDVGLHNKSPASKSQKESELSPELLEKIRDVCKLDLAVYEAVKQGNYRHE